MRWLTKLETITDIVQAARTNGLTVLGVRVTVRLGTGEKVESDLLEWVDLTWSEPEPDRAAPGVLFPETGPDATVKSAARRWERVIPVGVALPECPLRPRRKNSAPSRFAVPRPDCSAEDWVSWTDEARSAFSRMTFHRPSSRGVT